MAWTEASKRKMVATRKRNKKLKQKQKQNLPAVIPHKELHPDELPVVMLGETPPLEDFTRYMVLAWKLLHSTERK